MKAGASIDDLAHRPCVDIARRLLDPVPEVFERWRARTSPVGPALDETDEAVMRAYVGRPGFR